MIKARGSGTAQAAELRISWKPFVWDEMQEDLKEEIQNYNVDRNRRCCRPALR